MTLHALSFPSASDTARFGALLGRAAVPGDVIALYGELGAGKTCLTQGIAVGLGIEIETVTSPTYALINELLSGRIPLYHMDAYRIQDVSELGPIGFDDYVTRADGLLVIEWAGNIAGELPDERLDVSLAPAPDFDTRDASIAAYGQRSSRWLEAVLAQFQQHAAGSL